MLSLWKFNLLLLTLSVMFFGCRPPEEDTQYNIAKFQDPLVGNQCELLPEEGLSDADQIERCQLQAGCQAVLDNGNKYLGCMPIPSDDTPSNDPPAGDDDDDSAGPMPPAGDDDDDYTPPPSGDDDDDYTPPPSGDDDDDYTPPSSGDDDDDDDDNEDKKNPEDYRCGENGKKVLICHKAEAHDKHKNCGKPKTLCISEQGWLNGHSKSKHHEGVDHLGPCDSGDMEEPAGDPQLEIQAILNRKK